MPHVARLLSAPLIVQQALYFVARGEVNGSVKDVLLSYSIGSIASDVAASALQQLAKHRELAMAIPLRVLSYKNYVYGKGTPLCQQASCAAGQGQEAAA
jgi:hypothetical protein